MTLLIAGRQAGRFPLDAAVDNTLGRSTEASVTIPDRLASRAHAAIRFHTARREWILRDVGSRNGTWLNGRRIDVTPLTAGAVVRIGTSELVFELAADEPEVVASPTGVGADDGHRPPADPHGMIDLDEPVRAGEEPASRLSRHGTVVLKHPPAAAGAGPHLGHVPVESLVMQLPSLNLREWQRALIIEALRRHAGDVRAAAADLGVDGSRLHDVLARHGLVKPV